MQKKLAASFLLLSAGCTAVAVCVPLVQTDPLWQSALVVFLNVLLGLGAAWFMSHLVVRRIKSLAAAASVISRGDLTRSVDVHGSDETAELARSFETMLASLIAVLTEVRATAEQVHDSALALSKMSEDVNAANEGIADASRAIAKGAEVQAEQVARTSALTRDLTGSVDRVAAAARTVPEAAEEATTRASAGAVAARSAAEGIAEVSEAVDTCAGAIDGFQGRADQIGKIVTFIASLAEQTHLLAINATIEAARAGDDAQGFAIVADEVRRLADSVRGFTEQISSLSDEIREGAGTVARGIRDGARAASEARGLVDRAAASFDDILAATQGTSKRARSIATSSEEQRLLARQVDEALERIVRIARDNARGTEETSTATSDQTVSMGGLAASAHELAQTSDALKGLLASFTLRG